jgi:hypothetical protein
MPTLNCLPYLYSTAYYNSVSLLYLRLLRQCSAACSREDSPLFAIVLTLLFPPPLSASPFALLAFRPSALLARPPAPRSPLTNKSITSIVFANTKGDPDPPAGPPLRSAPHFRRPLGLGAGLSCGGAGASSASCWSSCLCPTKKKGSR